MEHILHGDIKVRVETQDKIITGGMHTFEGWDNFLLHHPDTAHIHLFNSKIHSSWYYARELQNGVITLKVPRELFGGKAAKITMLPDNYYKSGYLWKTLFPKEYGENEVLAIIEEALNNINKEATSEGEIIGYAKIDDPLKIMRVVIMFRDNKINSVFPSWTQPNTGNNGKAFSQFENIGYVINAATVYFGDASENETSKESFIDDNRLTNSLIENTPDIFLNRSKPGRFTEKWVDARDRSLNKYSNSINYDEALEVYTYVTDIEICKNYQLISKYGYNHEFHKINKSLKYFNVFQVSQNIIDSLTVLHAYDVKNNSNLFNLAIIYLLENMVTFVGIDSWVKRKIYVRIVKLLLSYNDASLGKEFIKHFSSSPTRREFYVEFSFDTQAKKELDPPLDDFPDELVLIENPLLSMKVKYKHFCEYLKENMGETYLLNFNSAEMDVFIDELVLSGGENYKSMIEDAIRYFTLTDFTSFSTCISGLINHLASNDDLENIEESSKKVIRDYCRIQSAQRFRLNLLYKDYHDVQIEFEVPPTKEFIYFTILKHERYMNTHRVNEFLDSMQLLLPFSDGESLEKDIIEFRDRATKFVPPTPDRIPKYIANKLKWDENEQNDWYWKNKKA